MSRISRQVMRFATILAAALPSVACAHPGHDAGGDLASGLLHPLEGADHLVALLAVGLLAGRARDVGRTAVTGLFVVMLAIGIACGFRGMEVPFSEGVMLASIIVPMVFVLWPPRRLLLAALPLVAGFAFCHGSIHGVEAAEGVARLQYGAGLVLGSSLMVGVGALLAVALPPRRVTVSP